MIWAGRIGDFSLTAGILLALAQLALKANTFNKNYFKGLMRPSPGLRIIESCLNCKLRTENFFCDLPPEVLQSFEAITNPSLYPRGVTLFMEGQEPRGIFVLCNGRVKLSASSGDGKTVIMKIAEPGEVLGLSATVSGLPYEVSAEAVDFCQVTFVKREDFLRFLGDNAQVCLRVAQHLSRNYHTAYEQVRSLALHTAVENLAKLLLEWCAEGGTETEQGIRLKLTLTHEEIGQMIGTTRETVGRIFAELRSKEVINIKGSTLLICNKTELETLANP